jgi:hypothetical protein
VEGNGVGGSVKIRGIPRYFREKHAGAKHVRSRGEEGYRKVSKPLCQLEEKEAM